VNARDRLVTLFQGYDAGGLLHLYRSNCAVLEMDRKNVAKMEEIVQIMKEELERRGLSGDLS